MSKIQTSLKNRIIVTYHNFTSGVTLDVAGFGTNRQGSFVFLSSSHVLNSDGTKTEIVIPVFEGTLEGVTLSTKNTLDEGDCYITADLWSGSSTANGFLYSNLIANYLLFSRALSYPMSPRVCPADGPGREVFETVADPAVATEFTFTPAANRLYDVISISYRLITDANAADRESHLHVNPTGDDSFFFPTTAVQAASLTRNVVFGHSLLLAAGTESIVGAIPIGMTTDSDSPISSHTNNIQAGDQIDQIQIMALRKIEI